MRLIKVGSFLILCWLAASPNPARAGGLGEEGLQPVFDGKYVRIPLPLSAASARTWIALHETMVKPPPDQAPLKDVLKLVRDALRGKVDKPSEIELYIDPLTLAEEGLTPETVIHPPFVGPAEVSLDTYLTFVLRPFIFTHFAHDKLVIVESPCDDCPGEATATAPEAWTWLVLHEVIPLKFADGATLEDVLKAIQRATVGKGKEGRGLVIHANPIGLREAEKELSSMVAIDLERAPLCTALGLVLQQLGLRFHVREDGVLVVTNREDEEVGPMDATWALDQYQMDRYVSFYDRGNDELEIGQLKRELAKHPAPAGPAKPAETGQGFRSLRPEPAGITPRQRRGHRSPRH
jgi:hypothetical protein